ncbi:thioredoxin domain-containing protein [Tepidibacillus marianensis]|uniref:thioredoxin domain-containing protein n=1 Tax=Tepidibacillus marianensis TaxID=3131995 RepID=UPI0030CB75B6
MPTNHLSQEKSPYLLQHADNPVDWYAWRDEAFEKAQKEDKPIFLSIGYSTCHWCHVMAHESFEDEEVAELLNSNFISIKVDREERPDVDHIYMMACQAMTGQGGWPLTIIMTPDKKPFFAGTYFPKRNRYGRPGLMEVLTKLADLWRNDRDGLLETSNQVVDYLKPNLNQFTSGDIHEEIINQAYQQFEKQFDDQYGGFGSAPKFPTPHNLMFLLRYWKKTKNEKALQMVETTIDQMYKGGIYDQIGYGFARYSTDQKWLVPHFEKMLFDNALLTYTYLEAYQATKNKEYVRIAEEILAYVGRNMTDSAGGFYSAEDADSECVEGKFYVWSPDEVLTILGTEEGKLYCSVYDITVKGNFEGKSIPNLIHTNLNQFAQREGLERDVLMERLEESRQKLFSEREKRIHPHKDDKILTSWNGLMIAAFAKAAQVLHRPEYSQISAKAIEFILQYLRGENGRLLARYREGEASYLGYLDDYAFLIWGLIEQYEATFDPYYLTTALELNEQMKQLFWDENNGGYYFYGTDAEELLTRPKEIYDGAIPSGNSVAALNLLKLARLTGKTELEEDAYRQLQSFAGSIGQYPRGYAYFLTAIQFALWPTKEIVISGEEHNPQTEKIIQGIQSLFLPDAVVLFRGQDKNKNEIDKIAPFTKDQEMKDEKTTVYICENFTCQAPIHDVSKMLQVLDE